VQEIASTPPPTSCRLLHLLTIYPSICPSLHSTWWSVEFSSYAECTLMSVYINEWVVWVENCTPSLFLKSYMMWWFHFCLESSIHSNASKWRVPFCWLYIILSFPPADIRDVVRVQIVKPSWGKFVICDFGLYKINGIELNKSTLFMACYILVVAIPQMSEGQSINIFYIYI